jgi:glucose/arabinose dehydrogenase
MRSLFAVVLAAVMAAPAPAPAKVATKVVATNLHVPWGIAFLPDGDALVTERTTARILRIPRGGGAPRTVRTLPGVDTDAGEGGLLGLALSPHYARDHWVYAYFTSATDNRIVRFRLHGAVHPILTGIRRGFNHNGGRIAFGPDGKLYAGVGETGDTSLSQDRSTLNGKILRINPDGSVPKGNPFGTPVWSYGHRNVQGLAWDRQGRLWASEFGQNETDEINLIRPGRNYGWPEVEGTGDTQGGRFTNPKVTWTPTSTASPSGIAIVGRRLYVAALAGESLFRIRLHGRRAGTPKRLYAGRYGRIRTVVRAPGGGLWIATSNTDGRGSPAQDDDRIIRIPA